MPASTRWSRFVTWWHGACIGLGVGTCVTVAATETDGPWRHWIMFIAPLCGLAAYVPVGITQVIDGVHRFRAAAK